MSVNSPIKLSREEGITAFQAWEGLLENPQAEWLHGLMSHSPPPNSPL